MLFEGSLHSISIGEEGRINVLSLVIRVIVYGDLLLLVQHVSLHNYLSVSDSMSNLRVVHRR